VCSLDVAGPEMPVGDQVWPPFRVQRSLLIVMYSSLAGHSSAGAKGGESVAVNGL
jgi:hypothetical protein